MPKPSPNFLTPDLCIIGAGTGGLALAQAAAALKLSIVLVEGAEMGGAAIASGAVPMRALAAAGQAAYAIRHAADFGLKSTEPQVNFAAVISHIRAVQARLALSASQARLEALGVHVIRAHARFTGHDRVEAGESTIMARRFVIATGSSPAPPVLEGIDLVRPIQGPGVFCLLELPARLVILGAGYCGVELAQTFRRLGSAVTLLDAGTALARIDPEMAAPVLRALALEGVVLREHAYIRRVEPRGTGVRLILAGQRLEETVDGSHLMLALGRRPNAEGLGLELAGVRFGAGGIETGPSLRTTNQRIHAIGSVTVAGHHASLASEHAAQLVGTLLLRKTAGTTRRAITLVATDPEVAVLGFSENEAREKFGQIRLHRLAFSDHAGAMATHDTAGLIKVITNQRGLICGIMICGSDAGESMALWALALEKSMNIRGLAHLPLPSMIRGHTALVLSREASVASAGLSRWRRWMAFGRLRG